MALDILFQADVRGENPADALADWTSDDRDVPEFAAELVRGVAASTEELDGLIGEAAHEWTLERMAAVDRTVLRLAVYQLLHRDHLPPAAATSEAGVAAKDRW